MIKLASDFTAFGYKNIVKHIFFLFSGDNIHKLMTNCGQIAGVIAPLRWFAAKIWRYDNPRYLAQVIKNVYIPNPVGLAGGFDKDLRMFKFIPSIGFGFAEGGSLTRFATNGNPRPHYRRLKKSKAILVNAGINNRGINVGLNRINYLTSWRKFWMPYNISIAKTNSPVSNTDEKGVKDYIASFRKLKKSGLGEMVTINISCPNVFGGEPFTTPDRLDQLLTEFDKIGLKQPVFLKTPIDQPWPKFKKLIDVVLKHNIAGVTIGNLAKDRTTPLLLDELSNDIPGGMSGKPCFKLSNDLIYETYKYCGDKLLIIGVGGIFNAKDAYTKIKNGSTLVEVLTGMIFEGPQLVGQINYGLVELLKKDGYTHISQAIGANHR